MADHCRIEATPIVLDFKDDVATLLVNAQPDLLGP